MGDRTGMTDVGVVGIAIPRVLAAVERIFVRPVERSMPLGLPLARPGNDRDLIFRRGIE